MERIGFSRRRLSAFIIDHVLITMIVAFPTFMMIGNEKGLQQFYTYFSFAMVGGFLLYLLKDAIGGASLGKRIYGLRVLREGTEERSGFWRLALRNLFMFVWPLELAFVVLSRRKLKLGDRLAGTALHQKEIVHQKRRTVVTVVAGVLLFVSIFVPSLGYIIKHSDSYETAIAYIENDAEVQQATGGITGYGFMPSGGFEIANGIGSGNYSIAVKGVQHNVKVVVILSYSNGESWHVDSMQIMK